MLSEAVRGTGLTPLTFLRHVTWEQVRQNLISSEGLGSGCEVSRRYGFTNSGHFSQYNRALFGEQPRETLNRISGT